MITRYFLPEDKSLKKLRQYRIPVDSMNNLKLELYHHGTIINAENSSISLVNLSGQGLAFELDKVIEGELELFLTIGSKRFDLNAKVARVVHNYQRRDLLLIGVEFIDLSQEYSMEIIDTLLNSLSSKNLKSLMLDMIQNEGEVAIDVLGKPSVDSNEDLNSIMVLDILKTFNRDLKSQRLLDVFARELCRQIGVRDYRLYLFENNQNDVYIYDPKVSDSNKSLFPVNGLIAKVRDKRTSYVSNVKEKLIDPFYNLLYAIYDIDIKNVILNPVFNAYGVLVGIVEFSNKILSSDNFNDEDIYEASIFATVVGTILFGKEVDLFENDINKLFKKYSDNLLIGTSSENQYINSCILEYAKTSEKILITGEPGVGKELVAKNIHKHSERSEYGVGVINCHDIYKNQEVDRILDSTTEHTGFLELYSGGTIIINDIDSLTTGLSEYLFKKIHNRSDIRFIATSTLSFEILCNFSDAYRPLVNFVCEHELHIPPLRERKDDIFLLSSFFVGLICEQNSFSLKNLGQDIVKYFHDYDWPGNVSELKSAIERLVIMEQQQLTLELKKSRIMPILDRDIDCDFLQGIDLSIDIVNSEKLLSDEELKELFFFFYVQNLLESKSHTKENLHLVFNMSSEEFDEHYYHAKLIYDNQFIRDENIDEGENAA